MWCSRACAAMQVSAGFDAAEGDQLGECHVSPAGYAHMTHMLSSLAGGKLVVALEVSRDDCCTSTPQTQLSKPSTLHVGRIQCRCDSQLVARMRQGPVGGDAAPDAVAACVFCWHADRASRHADAESVLGLHDADIRRSRRFVVETVKVVMP